MLVLVAACMEPYSDFADRSPTVQLANALLPLPERVFCGIYSTNFELSVFTPCGTRESWWVDGGHPVDFSRVNALLAQGDRRVGHRLFVAWRGRPSHRGSYGHMGCCEREFHVSEVLLARPARPDDCRQ